MGRKTFEEALLHHVSGSLEDVRLQQSALYLFRRVILAKRKKEGIDNSRTAGEMYRIADRIGDLLITSENEQTSCLCGSIYIDFTLNFPMTDKVQSYRIAHIVKNLGYKTDSGRKALLNCLHHFVKKCDSRLFESSYSAMLMLPLVTRLTDESESMCLKMVHVVLNKVFFVVNEKVKMKLIGLILKWKSNNKSLRMSMIKFCGVLIDIYGVDIYKKIDVFFEMFVTIYTAIHTLYDDDKEKKKLKKLRRMGMEN